MMKIQSVVQTLTHHAEVNQCSVLTYITEDLRVGEYVAQGDLNILRIAAVPSTAIPQPRNPQLCQGKTARHCIHPDDIEHCDFFVLPHANPLQGPIVLLNRPTTITHPEHGDQRWPACTVAITYQRRFSQQLERATD